ncbi:hypothetical protein [Paracoccus spongiarum]|uniref:Hedgehog/Intein (Hint) domain-containing protein n=1 Tax=Paracoccus spongiarum TaxID=3064387 RepID=A0ABT9JIU8_9RHOB|nr:hypothetical protein [Paracoccus sp. 2205BS29-5]MDP5308971.1 hypothetical protein [Paracoccus sp. 2205BS29-5]
MRPGTLRLARLDEVRQSGLTRQVRFDLGGRISVAPSHPGLAGAAGPLVVGHLCETALARLHAQRARVHALRVSAARVLAIWRRSSNSRRRTSAVWPPSATPAAAAASPDPGLPARRGARRSSMTISQETLMITTNTVGWAATLRPGTTVLFRFPPGEGMGEVKTRPGLVIAVAQTDRDAKITVAHGTTSASMANRGLELDLSDPADCSAAGLHPHTRFVLSRRITVASTDAAFRLSPAGTPVLGRLAGSSMMTLDDLVPSLGPSIAEDSRRGASPAARHTPAGREASRQRQRGVRGMRQGLPS